jgi:hypothetical protein
MNFPRPAPPAAVQEKGGGDPRLLTRGVVA